MHVVNILYEYIYSPFTKASSLRRTHSRRRFCSFCASAARVGPTDVNRHAREDTLGQPFGTFSESLYATVETTVLKMETSELKIAAKTSQHHSVFANSGVRSWLIQKTMLFAALTCFLQGPESTVAHNKNHCWMLQSIQIRSFELVRMQNQINTSRHCGFSAHYYDVQHSECTNF